MFPYFENEDYEKKELEILKKAVGIIEEKKGKEIIQNAEVQKIIKTVENFIKRKNLFCYGGTAINAILPEKDKFYNKEIELPDYDFYSSNALKDAKELADIFYKAGYNEVEAKAGIHHGTYKVFVNYISIADITQMDEALFLKLRKSAIKVDGIQYAPPNFLRMAMYLELSRPSGDVSRWEKVQTRLTLLNKNYPLKGYACNKVDLQRPFSQENDDAAKKEKDKSAQEQIYTHIRDAFIQHKAVFLGGYANILYSKYMPKKLRKIVEKVPDFDVLSETPEELCHYIKSHLTDAGYTAVKIVKHPGIGEVISTHYEIKVGEETISFVYSPLACHSYNTIHLNGEEVRVATIETMLSFYLAFIYADRPYYDENRILCMSQFLYELRLKNRLSDSGLLKRFSTDCYGKQETLDDIKNEKKEMYEQLKHDKTSEQYESWFLKYVPLLEEHAPKTKAKAKSQTKTKTKTKTKTQKSLSYGTIFKTKSKSKSSKSTKSTKSSKSKSSKSSKSKTQKKNK